MEMLVSERVGFKSALTIQDIASATLTDWYAMAGSLKLRCIVRVESAAADVQITLREAKDAAGTDAQNLVRCLPALSKVDGSATVEIAEDNTAVITVTDLNGAAGYVVVEVEGQNLSEGFTHFALSIDGGAARNGQATFESEKERKPAYEQD